MSDLTAWVKSVDWSAHASNAEVQKQLGVLKTVVEGGAAPTSGADDTAAPVVSHAANADDVDLQNCKRVKLVVVGDGAVGKTSLLISYATGRFPTEYVPTVFENYTAQLDFQGETILLHLWDTAGQEDYDRLRPLSYPGSDICLLCFSTTNKASYSSIKEKWYPEVNHYIPNVPHILVGTKVDCREAQEPDPNLGKFDPITTAMGQEMASSIKASNYVEVSSRTRKNLEEVFKEAVGLALEVRGDMPVAGGGAGAGAGGSNAALAGGGGGGAAAKPRARTRKKEGGGCTLL